MNFTSVSFEIEADGQVYDYIDYTVLVRVLLVFWPKAFCPNFPTCGEGSKARRGGQIEER